MQDWKSYFKGKKVTVMGLGLLGRGVGDAVFLAARGAEVLVTDLKSADELAPSLHQLKKFSARDGRPSGGKNISYTLGRHRLEDFRGRDFILKAAGVPLDSPYINEARKEGIPIEMSASLFTALLPEGVKVVGITGTRGKSTVSHLLFHILETAKKRAHLGGNIRGVSTLALLPKVKAGDIIVLELDSWQLQGFGERRISPHIAVFTNFLPDHLNYYQGDTDAYFKDKANIFKFQTKDDILIAGKQVVRYIVQFGLRAKIKSSVIEPQSLPKSWNIKLLGAHNAQNVALAIAAARSLRVSESALRRGVASFKGVEGRLELIRTVRGIAIYNDTTATTPDATIAALLALGRRKNIVLIMGGADKELDMTELLALIPKKCKDVMLMAGSGSSRVRRSIGAPTVWCEDLRSALSTALLHAKRGDIILFSPALASFGLFKNEFDRGDQFSSLVKKLS